MMPGVSSCCAGGQLHASHAILLFAAVHIAGTHLLYNVPFLVALPAAVSEQLLLAPKISKEGSVLWSQGVDTVFWGYFLLLGEFSMAEKLSMAADPSMAPVQWETVKRSLGKSVRSQET